MGSSEKPILERIEKVLTELSRSMESAPRTGLSPVAPDHHRRGALPATMLPTASHPETEPNDRLTMAIAWIRARKLRDDMLGGDLFCDPAWSILLELYVHHRQQSAMPITSLCAASGIPPSTGLRWVALLERRGLIARKPDPFDKRKIYAVLTAEAIERVEATLDSASESNRSLGIDCGRRVN